jgi:hypothetical protein
LSRPRIAVVREVFDFQTYLKGSVFFLRPGIWTAELRDTGWTVKFTKAKSREDGFGQPLSAAVVCGAMIVFFLLALHNPPYRPAAWFEVLPALIVSGLMLGAL